MRLKKNSPVNLAGIQFNSIMIEKEKDFVLLIEEGERVHKLGLGTVVQGNSILSLNSSQATRRL